MCLIAFALNAHADWPLLMLANRDEFHERPASPSAWWEPSAGQRLLAGRDLQGGGTWMGLSAGKTLAALTNIRQPAAAAGRKSRGLLVLDALSADSPDAIDLTGYASFNLLHATVKTSDATNGIWQMTYLNSNGERLQVPDGIHGLSNATLNSPWPKTRYLKSALQDMMNRPDIEHPAHAFAALSDRRTWPDTELPSTGVPLEWERMLSACHIISPAYGTRSSTFVRAHRSGEIQWFERTFDPSGNITAETVETLPSSAA